MTRKVCLICKENIGREVPAVAVRPVKQRKFGNFHDRCYEAYTFHHCYKLAERYVQEAMKK